MSEWQTIDTAPKDGTRAIVWSKNWHYPCSASWYGNDWRIVYDLPAFAHPPTHWMPLPPSPMSEVRV